MNLCVLPMIQLNRAETLKSFVRLDLCIRHVDGYMKIKSHQTFQKQFISTITKNVPTLPDSDVDFPKKWNAAKFSYTSRILCVQQRAVQ